jgi:5'-3' exonuclease
MKELYKQIFNEINYAHTFNESRLRNDKVLIIDGINTFIRTWSTNPVMNDDGEHMGGVVGTLKSIGSYVREFNPTRIIVVFDGKNGHARRKKIFAGYKLNRGKNRFRVNRQYPEMMTYDDEGESMKRQFVCLVDLLYYLPITTMIHDGIEADDVIAYITNDILKSQQSIIVSTDKDFLQLVCDNVSVYSPTKKIYYNRDAIYNEYLIYPENLLLFKTLDGDVSDNIPGIKGCGLKIIRNRFPVISENRLIEFDEFFKICENNINSYKIYSDILSNRDIILRNKSLMQLSDANISVHERLKILNRFNEHDRKFNKIEFLSVASKYKILQNWGDVNDWIKFTFSNIITK